ncbi:hypothetical protein ACG0Z6_06175 [Roseateles sp. BYS180W]|uniref:Pilus assembly protein PilX n=1 Tax=Roseateles rivi TaxID=3299028 RepID=A0ABW7FU25_9BURK
MAKNTPPLARRVTRSIERGMSLVFALIMLALMSLAAVAMIRAVDDGAQALGNMAMKEMTMRAADFVTQQAVTWLEDNAQVADTINGKDSVKGYYATYDPDWASVDFNGSDSDLTARIDWDETGCPGFGGTCLTPSDEIVINDLVKFDRNIPVKGRYVVLRLCSDSRPQDSGTQCARVPLSDEDLATDRGELNAANPRRLSAVNPKVYYRIIVRSQGPRNSVTYTEALVHF